MKLSSSGFSGSDNYQLTLMQNGAATGITCTVTGTSATTCADATHTVTVAVGDTLSLRAVPGSGPSNAPVVAWSVKVQ